MGIGRGPGTHFCSGPIWVPFGDPFLRAESWGSVGALGPILGGMIHGIGWGPGAHLEAEGRLNGGLGAEPPTAGVRGRQPPGAPRGLALFLRIIASVRVCFMRLLH